jgi:iron complex outermembrane receptor protein
LLFFYTTVCKDGKVQQQDASQETCPMLNIFKPSGRKVSDAMTWKYHVSVLFLFFCSLVQGQNDTIVRLQEVLVSDSQLKRFSDSQHLVILSDSVLNKNNSTFTNLLAFNSPIYFKENGAGMVSSPAFRGTSAQQTAVVWNGININSQLTGLTDFNTINGNLFNSIGIRAGGGSVLYGSGAIGGSIHLTNFLKFNSPTSHFLNLNYGSFATFNGNYKFESGSEKWATQLSIVRNSSDNDYEYIGRNQKNENGQFYNNGLHLSVGHKINENNFLKFYSYWFESERHFSGTITVRSRSKYDDFNTRNMVEWVHFKNRFTSKIKLAYLTEHYHYFENKDNDSYTFGKVNTILNRYDLSYQVAENIDLNTVFDLSQNTGEGSDILSEKRTIGAGSLLWKHQLTSKFNYEIGFRKEYANVYESPFLYSAGAQFKISDNYLLKANASKNYRIPTFNDLYWQGSGNKDLRPEQSIQAELGQVIQYRNTSLTVTGYYIKLNDMLRWLPTPSGLWKPENTDKVNSYGVESLLESKINFGAHHFQLNATYAYTVSERPETGNQLIYIPFHKANGSIAYSFEKVTAFFQTLYVGEVFTSTDNFYSLDAYRYSNAGIEYHLGKKNKYQLGFQIQNIENTNYQNVASRPMPGRQYQVSLTLNFI